MSEAVFVIADTSITWQKSGRDQVILVADA